MEEKKFTLVDMLKIAHHFNRYDYPMESGTIFKYIKDTHGLDVNTGLFEKAIFSEAEEENTFDTGRDFRKTHPDNMAYEYGAVYIEWLDSAMKLPVWFSTQKLIDETEKPSDCFQTIAYLVRENEKEYILCGSIHTDGDGVCGFGQVFTIPKGCVTKIQKIQIP